MSRPVRPGQDVFEVFETLRERLKSGVRRVLEINRKEPHYIAALTMVVGCEAVGRLLQLVDGRRRQEHEVFVEDLVIVRGVPGALGIDLFDSIRNGIAHLFQVKPIRLKDSTTIVVGLQWGAGGPHFNVRRRPLGLWLNLQAMQVDFERMLDKYRDVLRTAPRSGQTITIDRDPRDRESAWRAFMSPR